MVVGVRVIALPFRVHILCLFILLSFVLVSFHGNFLSGADSTAVNLLSAGEGVQLKVAEWADASSSGS